MEENFWPHLIQKYTQKKNLEKIGEYLKKNSFVGVKKLIPEDEELQKTFRTLYAYDIKHYDQRKETEDSTIIHD